MSQYQPKYHPENESFVHQVSFPDDAGRLTPAGMENWRQGVQSVLDHYDMWRILGHTVTPITEGGTIYGIIVTVIAQRPDTSAD